MTSLPTLMPGDTVEIIAPASRCDDGRLQAVKSLLASWQLKSIIAEDIFGDDLLCANSDEVRFKHLERALANPEVKAIICIRGGYGSMRLIPALTKLPKPSTSKIFVGMSDTTALHLYFQNHWQWHTIHGGISPDKFSTESINALRQLLFATSNKVTFDNLQPLNEKAQSLQSLTGEITGGNLTLIQASIGTTWQLQAEAKIVLLEEVGERAYRVDRIFEHLKQANILAGAKAIILGDFLEGEEPDGSSLIAPTLKRFAIHCEIPVFKLDGIGHGHTNYPLPLGASATLSKNEDYSLTINR